MRLTRWRVAFSTIGLALGLMLLLGYLQPAMASQSYSPTAAPLVSFEVKAGFDSYYKEHDWLPVQVTLNLPGGQNAFQGRVEASFSNFSPDSPVFQRAVQLAPPARKTVWLYLTTPRAIRQLQVRLVADDGTAIAGPIDKTIGPLTDTSLLLGVVSDDTSALNYLNSVELANEPAAYSPFFFGYSYNGKPSLSSTKPKVTIAHLSLNDLPTTGPGWNSLDGLIISDINANFTGDQEAVRKAMSGWLAQGGALFVAGDSALRHAPFVQSFLPVQSGPALAPPRSVDTSQLSELIQYLGPAAKASLPAGNLVLADAPLAPGSRALVNQNGKALLSTRPFGLGQSWFWGLDLKPLRNWDAMPSFWKTVFENFRPRVDYATAAYRANEGPYYEWSVRLTPSPQAPQLPGPWWLALFLGVYIFAVGPLNYFILRRFDKREWAWITVPVLTLLFSAGAYLVGNVSSQTEAVVSRLSIVTMAEANDGSLSGSTDGLVGLYSNGRNDFEIKVAEDALATSVFRGDNGRYPNGNANNAQFLIQKQGPGGSLGRISLGIRAQHSFAFKNDGTDIQGIRARIKLVNGNPEGTVENLSNKTWEDLSLVLAETGTGKSVYSLGNLGPGEKRQLNLASKVSNAQTLAQTITGVANYTRNGGNPNNPNKYSGPPYYFSSNGQPASSRLSQKALVLETLLGPDGEGLFDDKSRFYLFGWRNEAKTPISIEGYTADNYDLTLLFEPLAIDS